MIDLPSYFTAAIVTDRRSLYMLLGLGDAWGKVSFSDSVVIMFIEHLNQEWSNSELVVGAVQGLGQAQAP